MWRNKIMTIHSKQPPIARDDRIHIDYVPTQVVTEYVRSARFPDGRLDGIRYRSSRREGGISVVLFADQTNVIGAHTEGYAGQKSDQWLELVNRTDQTVSRVLLDSITAIAAPVGQRKSLIALNVAHALCTGEPLFDYFKVVKQASRVIYLCPEMGISSFSMRLKQIGLASHVGQTLFC